MALTLHEMPPLVVAGTTSLFIRGVCHAYRETANFSSPQIGIAFSQDLPRSGDRAVQLEASVCDQVEGLVA